MFLLLCFGLVFFLGFLLGVALVDVNSHHIRQDDEYAAIEGHAVVRTMRPDEKGGSGGPRHFEVVERTRKLH